MAARTFSDLVDGEVAGPCPPTDAAVVELASEVLTVSLVALGAATHRVLAPDRDGVPSDVHLHLGSLAERADRARNPHLGSSIGRWAGRIGGATFPLDGRSVVLDANQGSNQLHGGPDGFDRRRWDVLDVASTAGGGAVVFGLTSPDGDQGFPGRLDATATYELEGDRLTITYRATTDAPTVVNLCHHGYWNLDGGLAPGVAGPIDDHVVAVAAERVLPVDDGGLPTGEPIPVSGTPTDLGSPTALGPALAALDGGFDHTYAIDGEPGAVRPAAWLLSPRTGRRLAVETDQPGLQVYSGDHLRPPFAPRSSLSLEAQRFPDSPNRPALGPSRLDPGQEYASTTTFTFGTDA
ncbi:galactose mutarotase [Aquihabitans sp. G128]|uniref:aldose epimerase family protein n=1 Tax=Aquihabitans sp. G128 TaxID=2849779 RepID=UPI001C245B0D|nr:aldose epimerase family protein [Aquihabitans sp. G128]QXC61168.1 galactose mutarotase [Aquihabitans sp. G128]